MGKSGGREGGVRGFRRKRARGLCDGNEVLGFVGVWGDGMGGARWWVIGYEFPFTERGNGFSAWCWKVVPG